jgi:hypothetical protein
MRRYVQRDLRRCRLAVCTEVGHLHRLMFSKVNSGLPNGYIERNNIDPNVGLRFRF